MNKKDKLEDIKESYYSIRLAFKVTRDVLNEVDDPNVVLAREVLYKKLGLHIPNPEYEVFSSTLVIYRTEDDLNYIIVYSSFVRNSERLPMDSYVTTNEIKESIRNEFINFFDSISIEYKLVNIKSLV